MADCKYALNPYRAPVKEITMYCSKSALKDVAAAFQEYVKNDGEENA